MPQWGHYACVIGDDGHVQNRAEVHCDNDEEAKRCAELVDGYAIELWQEARKARRFSLRDCRRSSLRYTEPKSRHVRRRYLCSQCDKINATIARLRHLAGRITDQQTLDGIDRLTAEMETSKAPYTKNEPPSRSLGGRSTPNELIEVFRKVDPTIADNFNALVTVRDHRRAASSASSRLSSVILAASSLPGMSA
jgi:hypothetical protein